MRVNKHELLFVEGGKMEVVTKVHFCLKTMGISDNEFQQRNEYIHFNHLRLEQFILTLHL